MKFQAVNVEKINNMYVKRKDYLVQFISLIIVFYSYSNKNILVPSFAKSFKEAEHRELCFRREHVKNTPISTQKWFDSILHQSFRNTLRIERQNIELSGGKAWEQVYFIVIILPTSLSHGILSVEWVNWHFSQKCQVDSELTSLLQVTRALFERILPLIPGG